MPNEVKLLLIAAAILAGGCEGAGGLVPPAAEPTGVIVMERPNDEPGKDGNLPQNDEEWRRRLTPEQFRVLRQKGTEPAFTGAYWNEHRAGRYLCAACGEALFDGATKFESGTGWPSFSQPIAGEVVATETDSTLGMARTEVHCSRCGGHLGHVFEDGPRPTGLRYCINSVSLRHEADAPPPPPEG